MKTSEEPIEIESLTKLNEYSPDDLFVCCAGFEDRCFSSTSRMSVDFRTRFAVIFLIEEPQYKERVEANLSRLRSELGRRAAEGIFVIRCRREDPIEGITQLRDIWDRCRPRDSDEPFITIDISGFTKIQLFELLHYLVVELNLGIPRLLHTTQTYSPAKLSQGVQQITTIHNFFGSISYEKQTILVLLLGFEPDRSLAVWKHFNPARTIALITNPPRYGNLDYVEYARKSNSRLLSQPHIELRDVPADNPYAVKNVLKSIYSDMRGSFNMVIGPFGTKPQVVGVFFFCLDHPKVQVVYSFPVDYTRSYLERKPGPTLLLPLPPIMRS